MSDLTYEKSQTLRKEPRKIHAQVDKPTALEINLKFGQNLDFIPKHSKQAKLFVRIPSIEQVLQYCWNNIEDDECKKIIAHTISVSKLRSLPDETLEALGLLKKKRKELEERGYFQGRSGGGWRGFFRFSTATNNQCTDNDCS